MLFQMLGEGVLSILGSPILVTAMVIFFLVMILLLSQTADGSVGVVIILMVLVPLLGTIASNIGGKYLNIPLSYVWVSVVVWGAMGVVLTFVYFAFIK